MSRPKFRHTKKNTRSKGKFTPREVKLTIEQLGSGGDGIAYSTNGSAIYIPYTLPGEEIEGQTVSKRNDGLAAKAKHINNPNQNRVPQRCQHFEKCGGCSMQHLSDEAIATWKRDKLHKTLSQKGLEDFYLNKTQTVSPGARRRASFAVKPLKDKCIFGFNSAYSKTIIDLENCPLLTKSLMDSVPTLRDMCQKIEGFAAGGDLHVTETDNGLDILFLPNGGDGLTLADREYLNEFAKEYQVARIGWKESGWVEPVVALLPADIQFANTKVAIPIGAFLQPSQEGQDLLVKLVADAVGDSARIADFYCGCGTFTLPLAQLPHKPIVHAADGLEEQVGAMRKAVAGQKITVESIDLAKNPPSTEELNSFDAVVFDPPRAGAQRFAEQLAYSNVKKVIAVSCNPATLARDLQILENGGYELQEVTPVDQFTWTSHLEAVAILTKKED